MRECLDWHNLLRARHGVGLAMLLMFPLSWKGLVHFNLIQAAELKLCPALCAEAQTWANVLAHLNQFYHQNPPEVSLLSVSFAVYDTETEI